MPSLSCCLSHAWHTWCAVTGNEHVATFLYGNKGRDLHCHWPAILQAITNARLSPPHRCHTLMYLPHVQGPLEAEFDTVDKRGDDKRTREEWLAKFGNDDMFDA